LREEGKGRGGNEVFEPQLKKGRDHRGKKRKKKKVRFRYVENKPYV